MVCCSDPAFPTRLLLNFNKIKNWTTDLHVVTVAVQKFASSSMCTYWVSEDGTKIGKRGIEKVTK